MINSRKKSTFAILLTLCFSFISVYQYSTFVTTVFSPTETEINAAKLSNTTELDSQNTIEANLQNSTESNKNDSDEPKQNSSSLDEGEKAAEVNDKSTEPAIVDDSVGITYVIVDSGCHQSLHMVLENIFMFANESDKVFIWHSRFNEKFLTNGIEKHPELKQKLEQGIIRLTKIDPKDYGDFDNNIYSGGHWYSRFMTSKDLWGSVETEIAITMQGDTIICHAINETFFEKFSYLGGPSPFRTTFKDHGGRPLSRREVTTVHLPPDPVEDRIVNFHMNGGFSFRNVTWVKECIDKYGVIGTWIDDDLYNYCLKNMEQSHQVTEYISYATSSDNGNTKCFSYKGKRYCPFGVHKPWQMRSRSYDELVNSCPGLDLLSIRQHRYTSTTQCTVQFYNDTEPTPIECDC